MVYGGERPGTGPLFRLAWRGSHYPGRPVEDLWIALDRDAGGGWWFDGYFFGRLPLGQGAPRAAEFARWLLAAPPTGPYEWEFTLIDREPQAGSPWIAAGTLLTVEFLLGREEADGPEYLQMLPSGRRPCGTSASRCAHRWSASRCRVPPSRWRPPDFSTPPPTRDPGCSIGAVLSDECAI